MLRCLFGGSCLAVWGGYWGLRLQGAGRRQRFTQDLETAGNSPPQKESLVVGYTGGQQRPKRRGTAGALTRITRNSKKQRGAWSIELGCCKKNKAIGLLA
jgi:hypothetical protein